jgi:hypothetical protein
MQGDDILVTVPHDLNESLDKHIVACIIVLCIKTTFIFEKLNEREIEFLQELNC